MATRSAENIAQETILFVLSQHPAGIKMNRLTDAINALPVTEEVARMLGRYVDPSQQRTYLLRRLKRMEAIGWVKQEGKARQGVTWRIIPEQISAAMAEAARRQAAAARTPTR